MAALSKAEYLKRYMSKDELPAGDRKKKKKRKLKNSNMRIIDDDVDLVRPKDSLPLNPLDDDEEQPTVVEVIDERPQHIQDLEMYQKSGQWRALGTKNRGDGIIIPGSSSPPSDSSPPRLSHGPVKRNSKRTKQRHDSNSDSSPPRKSRSQRHDSDSDTSPPRKLGKESKLKADNEKFSTFSSSPKRRKRRHDSDSDQSPPRSQSPVSAPDQSQYRRKVNASDSDQSPFRGKKSLQNSGHSPVRRTRDNSNSDQPRNKEAGSDSDQSPPRNKGAGSDSDQSPPRNKGAGSDSDQSPPRNKGAGSDSDQSPPRNKGAGADSDQSPPRKKPPSSKSDQSSSRKKDDAGLRISPKIKRKSRFDSPDTGNHKQSPKQIRDHGSKAHSPSSKRRHDSESDSSPPRRSSSYGAARQPTSKPEKTLGGAKAGLSSATEMRKEAKKLKDLEDKSFKKIDDVTLGKNAQTVMRDKSTGKRRNLEAEKELTEEEERKKEEQMKKFQQWGKGLHQQKQREERLMDHVHEASKPLARYENDEDLDKMMRGEERAEDPMLAFIRNKKKKQEEKSGKKKKSELPRYNGPTPPPPNRFNIMPGYRWDGVDRSNGFENKLFASIANKKAVKEIAYKWSTEDM